MNPAFFVCIGVSLAEPVRVSPTGAKVLQGEGNVPNYQHFMPLGVQCNEITLPLFSCNAVTLPRYIFGIIG